jgi:hypothetical protein
MECRMASAITVVGPAPTATSSLTIAKTCSLPYLSASCWPVAKNAYQSSGVHVPLEFGEVQVVVTGHSEIPSAFTIPLPRYGPTGPLSRPRAMYLSGVMEIASCRCEIPGVLIVLSRDETVEERLPEVSPREHVSSRAVRRVLKK